MFGKRVIVFSLLSLFLLAGCGTSPAAEPTGTPVVNTPTQPPTSTPLPPTPAPPSPTPVVAEPTEEVASPTPDALPEATPLPTPTPTAVVDDETSPPAAAGYALRFFGTGSGDIDRVKIAIDDPANGSLDPPVDVGATDFTLEWWLKTSPNDNLSGDCTTGNDNWITGNIIFDRDIWGNGDYGDYGVSLAGGKIAFGVNNGSYGEGICSASNVADGLWHHIAVTRRLDGLMHIFVDGQPEAEIQGAPGDVSYRNGRPTDFEDDPFLVMGAEKHDAGAEYPSYNGWLDEVRLSTVVRYDSNFARPTTPFQPDADTAALWHFDEGSGEQLGDSAAGGLSVGAIKVGGPNQGPQWAVSDAPLSAE